MRRMMWVLTGLVLGGGLMWGALKYHVLRTSEGLKLVPKRNTTLADTYLDVRSWGLAEWSQHPDLAWSLAESGQTSVMSNAGTMETTLKDALKYVK